jgi:phosphoribosylaminoimidazole-succinocarboxamide synthase
MPLTQNIRETNFPRLKLISRGKVRDIYDLGDQLLLVATDRMSAFDVIMNEPIPDKGRVLTQISGFWFYKLKDIIPNHVISMDVNEYPPQCQPYSDILRGRSMLVRKCKPLPVECIVRGYLSGFGWAEYKKTGEIKGNKLPPGLVESDRLPLPIFTPSTKAELGLHDENISFDQMAVIIGGDLANQVRTISLALYTKALAWTEPRSIIIADTKFEFGLCNGQLLLIDEVLTPDSSRFWPEKDYKPGGSQKSYDKQYLRDYLESIGWNKQPPPPPLPSEVISNTRMKYLQALEAITGE